MKYLLFLLVSITLLVTFTGCSDTAGYAPNQKEIAYAYTHGGYVGKAEVTVDDDGNLTVDFDEAFLPHTLAIVDIDEDEWNDMNTASYISHGNPNYVAKFIEYNDKVYFATATGTGLSYVEADENGNASGSTDLEKAILRNQASMAAYYASISAGKFKILSDFSGTATAVTTTHYGGVTKNDSPGYWDSGQTWLGNMTAIEDFIAKNGVQFSLSEMERAKEENSDGLKVWSVADAVSGATNSDFKDYFGLAQLAAGRLKTN